MIRSDIDDIEISLSEFLHHLDLDGEYGRIKKGLIFHAISSLYVGSKFDVPYRVAKNDDRIKRALRICLKETKDLYGEASLDGVVKRADICGDPVKKEIWRAVKSRFLFLLTVSPEKLKRREFTSGVKP